MQDDLPEASCVHVRAEASRADPLRVVGNAVCCWPLTRMDGWMVVMLAVEPGDVKKKEKKGLLTRTDGGRRGRTDGVRVDSLRVVEDVVYSWRGWMDGWWWCWPSSLGM